MISVGRAMTKHAYERLESHAKWGEFEDIGGLAAFCVETFSKPMTSSWSKDPTPCFGREISYRI